MVKSRVEILEDHLKSISAVTHVRCKPLRKGKVANDHGVSYKFRNTIGNVITRRKACSTSRPSLVECFLDALEDLRAELGSSAVPYPPAEDVEEPEPIEDNFSAEELEWLAEWFEEHLTPEAVTLKDAEEALRAERAKHGRSAHAVLKEVQLHLAQHKAAKRALEQAKSRLSAIEALPDVRHQLLTKRKRMEEEWMSRPYASYDTVEIWRKLESESWNRRHAPLSDKPGKLKGHRNIRRGERDGVLHHWRRGLVGAVCDWAEGSREDAVTLIVALIRELDLQVCPKWPPPQIMQFSF